MKLGTHNSMSYLPPKKWWMYPFRFVAKCQSKSIKEQYELGARMFDLRVAFTNNLTLEFRHGAMAFKGDVEDILKYLNSLESNIYIRLLLEINKEDSIQEELFKITCKRWEAEYPNLRFFCGRRKFGWKQLYQFKVSDINVIQKVSSMTGTILNDWCPWFYARFYNKKNFDNRNASEWLLLDFVQYALE